MMLYPRKLAARLLSGLEPGVLLGLAASANLGDLPIRVQAVLTEWLAHNLPSGGGEYGAHPV